MAIFNSFMLNYQRVSSENHNMSLFVFFIFDPNVGGSGIHGSARLEGSRGEQQSFGGFNQQKIVF